MRQIIGIAGRESGYWVRLMEYINSRGQMEAFVCTSEECLAKELELRQPVVLFREQDFAREVDYSGREVMIYSDRRRRDGIYQFQSAEQIYEAMVTFLEREEPAAVYSPEVAGQIYAVYSPLGRSGKTSFALAYAGSHSFFYLGMEDYGLPGNKIHDMGEVLYHIRNRTENIVGKLTEWGEVWNGVRMLGSPGLFQDIKLLTLEDYSWFFNQIREAGALSVMVDMGTGCLMDFEMFQLFDRVYVPVLPGRMNQEKLALFWQLILEVYGEISDKFRVIEVPDLDWMTDGFLELVQESEERGGEDKRQTGGFA